MKRISYANTWLPRLLLVPILGLGLSGCMTSREGSNLPAKLTEYRKVYLFETRNDFRKVHPRLIQRINKGLVSSAFGIADDTNHVQFSAAVQPGNSGGPLLNERVEVIGVVEATLSASSLLLQGSLPQNVNFAIKNGPVREFLGAAGI